MELRMCFLSGIWMVKVFFRTVVNSTEKTRWMGMSSGSFVE
ncbi:MAG: hypothetical protein IT576_00095 [Verrucomicrobiales bacterium]|nr:hypothetical protein [Verrucomicrobiales bacterium]